MKKCLLYSITLGIFTSLILFLLYPYSLQNLEGDALFLITPEFLKEVFLHPPGILHLINNFLLQFFKDPLTAAILTSVPLVIITFSFGFLLKKIYKKNSHIFMIIPALLSIVEFYDYPEILWSNAFLLVFLNILLIHKNLWIRGIKAIILTFITYLFLPFPHLVFLYFILLICDYFIYKEKSIFYFLFLSFILIFILPFLWSHFFTFIAQENRYDFNFKDTITNYIYIIFFAIGSIILLLKKTHWKKQWINWTFIIIAFFITFSFMKFRKTNNEDEFFYKISYLADDHEWQEILNEIPYNECRDQIRLKYALLAQSELGTLPENIFKYPIFSSNDFCFNHQYAPFLCNFNRQFYTCLGIPDEGFHQAFEYGVLTQNGICFKSLRNMIDCALDVNDKALAKKYIDLLKTSSCHSSWLKSRIERMNQININSTDKIENRSITFIAAVPFIQELAYLSLHKYGNKKIFDYLLCSILLERKLGNFASVLMEENYYKGKMLPKAYSEAALMILQQKPELAHFCHIPHEVMQNLRSFVQLKKSGNNRELLSQFGDSYWVYFNRE